MISSRPFLGMMTPADSLGPLAIVRSTLQAMPVGRDHPALGAVALEEHAVQVEPGLVVADREQRALDHLAQHRGLERGVRRLAMIGHLGEVAVGHPDDAVGHLAALDLGPVVIRLLERDLVAGRVRDQLVEVLGAERDAAFARVGALELRGQRDVEIGGGDQQLVLALGAQQDVREHRHRALAIGDALSQAQPAKELGLCDAKLHGSSTFVRLFDLISKRKILLELVVSRRCGLCG